MRESESVGERDGGRDRESTEERVRAVKYRSERVMRERAKGRESGGDRVGERAREPERESDREREMERERERAREEQKERGERA